MPYRLDSYDAMASLAVTYHTATKRRSVAAPTPSGAHLRASCWSAGLKELAGRSGRYVPGRGTGAKSTGRVAETLWVLSGAAQRAPLGPDQALPDRQKGR